MISADTRSAGGVCRYDEPVLRSLPIMRTRHEHVLFVFLFFFLVAVCVPFLFEQLAAAYKDLCKQDYMYVLNFNSVAVCLFSCLVYLCDE